MTVTNRLQTMWRMNIFSFIVLVCLTQYSQVSANTCVTFPNDTSSCSHLALTCTNLSVSAGQNITYDSFKMSDADASRSPTSHVYATCRLGEVCGGMGSTQCDVIEDVLTELEPSLCPGMCYYVIIPHAPCNEAANHISTVYMMNVPQGNTDINVQQVQSSSDATEITVNNECNGITMGEVIDQQKECNIPVDQTCPGTSVQTFEADTTLELEIKSVNGEKSVSVAFQTPFDFAVTALTTIYDSTSESDHSEEDNSVEGVGDADTKLVLGSVVIDIVLIDESGSQIVLENGQEIHLTFGSTEPGGFKERVCHYFDEDVSKWSGYGCYVSSFNSTDVTCACNHTTSFAVLLQFEDCTIDGANLKIQTLMTRFFNAISIAALFLAVIIFCYLKLYSSDQVKVHICLAISLALAQTVMLFMGQTQHKAICRGIAGIMHYLLTAYCISMMLEGILLHRKASRTHKGPVKGWLVVLCVWGIPVVVVAVLMGSVPDGYGGECACWLNVQYGTMWVWLAQVVLVIVVNTVLLYLIMRTFVSLKANTKKSDTDRLKATARAMLIMVPMLGMTWVFAILQAYLKDVFLQWIFILLNALQGPLFFVFQCVMHHEVQKAIGRKRKVGDSSKWAMNSSTSGTGRTESTDKGTSHFTETKMGKGL